MGRRIPAADETGTGELVKALTVSGVEIAARAARSEAAAVRRRTNMVASRTFFPAPDPDGNFPFLVAKRGVENWRSR